MGDIVGAPLPCKHPAAHAQPLQSRRETASTQLNVSLWWRHNIELWRHNGARRHARAKHYEYFMLENCTIPLVYIDPRILLNYYTFVPGKPFKIESSDIFQILEYFQNFNVYFINRYLIVWGFSIVFPQVPLF